MDRKLPDFVEEEVLWNSGYDLVIGIDEVGRGCFAGPVVASACAFPLEVSSQKLNVVIDDSKRLKPQERKRSAEWIRKNCLAYGIGEVGVSVINKVGIGKATMQAMRLAIQNLESRIQNSSKKYLLVDAFHIRYVKGIGLKNQKAIIKGDQKSISIAAASILAKVYRDNLMQDLSKKHSEYGWARNKGYGTKDHQEAIKKNGLTKLHRIVFVETFLRTKGLTLQS